MAVETIEVEEATPDSVARSTDGETVEVALPEGLEASQPKPPASPEAVASTVAAQALVAPPVVTPPSPSTASVVVPPVAETQSARAPLPPSTKEERRKRKYWHGVAERVTAERDAALERLGMPVPRRELKPDPARGEALRKAADEASSVGAAAQLTAREVLDQFNDWQKQFLTDLDSYLHRRELRRMELDFKYRNPDYEDTCRKAGIFEACQVGPDGQWQNAAIARAVYFDEAGHPRANPIEAGYELAHEILKGTGTEDSDEPTAAPASPAAVRAETVTAPAAPVAPVPPAAAATTETIADAERRGARQVAERVAETSTRQRGISLLRGAGGGPPQVKLDEDLRRHLDEWDRKDPVACGKWFDANPKIADWWTNG